MNQDTSKHTSDLLKRAKNILICLPNSASPDEITGALALQNILKSFSSEKKIKIITSKPCETKDLSYLQGINTITNSLPPLSQLTIKLDLKKTHIDTFSYDIKDNKLEIYIQPHKGNFIAENITTEHSHYHYDTIVTLGVLNFASLGNIFEQAPDFFYTTTVVNIDHQIGNELYGEINAIDLNTSSVCEIIYDITHDFLEEQPDKNIATQILSGILYKTKGLKSLKISPQLLSKISHLVKFGANITEINSHLFHHETLQTLKLWGRTLARLKEDGVHKIIWSLIPHDDFIKTNTTDKDLPNIISDLIETYHSNNSIFLLWQNNKQSISGILKTLPPNDALKQLHKFNPKGRSDFVFFETNTNNLLEAEKQILDTLRG